jgi:hypothetical protein
MKTGIIALLAKRAASKGPAKDESPDEPEAEDSPAEEGGESTDEETRMAGVSIAKDVREAMETKDDEKLYDALCELIKSHGG